MWLRAQCLFVNTVTCALGWFSTRALLFAVSHVRVRGRRAAHAAASIEDAFADTVVWLPMNNTCIRRAAALTVILRRHGYPARMAVGYRPTPFQAHAWVELEGQVLGDHPGYQRKFLSFGTW